MVGEIGACSVVLAGIGGAGDVGLALGAGVLVGAVAGEIAEVVAVVVVEGVGAGGAVVARGAVGLGDDLICGSGQTIFMEIIHSSAFFIWDFFVVHNEEIDHSELGNEP